MNADILKALGARFRAESEADLNYGIAEGLDPLEEYNLLVQQLNGSHLTPARRTDNITVCAGGSTPRIRLILT